MKTPIIISNKTACVYIRMSTDDQQTSPARQREAIADYAAKNNFKTIREYADLGLSGTDVDRPQFRQLLSDAQQLKDFDCILVWSLDRFSRSDSFDSAEFLAPLRRLKIKLFTVDKGLVDLNTMQGRMHYAFDQEFRNQFSRTLSMNVSSGKLHAARMGKFMGTPPIGYDCRDGKLFPNSMANLVKEIYSLYLNGKSLRGIAESLNERGILSKNGKGWSGQTVGKLLRNPTYVGDVVYNRYHHGKFSRTQRGVIVPLETEIGACRNDIEDLVIVADKHEPLVSRQDFARVKLLLDRNKQNTARKDSQIYPLAGLLVCGHCGGKMCSRKSNGTYNCSTAKSKGKTACRLYAIKESEMISGLIQLVTSCYLNESGLTLLREELTKQATSAVPDHSALQKQIATLGKKVVEGSKRLLDLPSELVADLTAELQRIKSEKSRLEAELQVLQSQPTAYPTDVVDAALALLPALSQLDPTSANRTAQKDFFQSILTSATLYFVATQRGKRNYYSLSHGEVLLSPTICPEIVPLVTGSSLAVTSRTIAFDSNFQATSSR